MKNIEALERLSQSHCSVIEKLIWIASSMEGEDITEFLYHMDQDDWKEMIPEIGNSEYFAEYYADEEMTQALVDYNKFGFLAEVLYPECKNFSFDKDRPVSWQVNGGVSRVAKIYAETLEELIEKIEAKGKLVFAEYLEKENSLK